MEIQIGPDVISAYKRLSYKPWYAIAEFVDNATQSYFDNRAELDSALSEAGERFTVRIVYDDGILRIYDNAMGMSQSELENGLRLAFPPKNATGRSRYGMGMKTASFWVGNTWSISTKKLGETIEHKVTLDLDEIASGKTELVYEAFENRPIGEHFTLIEIWNHNQNFKGRTLGKIEDYLSSIYREDIRNSDLVLEWRGKNLTWSEPELLSNEEENRFYQEFSFEIDGNKITGWVGILKSGSRAKAGFSILQNNRVIKGWPEAWRPYKLFGLQEEGTNNLVNQRLVGEIYLTGFEVSHTKDDILWLGDQEERVEKALFEKCVEYKRYAEQYRKYKEDSRGPSPAATEAAMDELQREMESPEMLDKIKLTLIPPQETIKKTLGTLLETVIQKRQPTFSANMGGLVARVYAIEDMSPSEPYVASQPSTDEVIVVVNQAHPHWKSLNDSDVMTHLRHCVYDAVAEWQSRSKASRIDSETIKILKDALLRVPFEIEQHSGESSGLYYKSPAPPCDKTRPVAFFKFSVPSVLQTPFTCVLTALSRDTHPHHPRDKTPFPSAFPLRSSAPLR